MAASTRWIVLAALAAGLTAAATVSGSAAGESKSSAAVRPNVLVLMTDDQTVESMRRSIRLTGHAAPGASRDRCSGR